MQIRRRGRQDSEGAGTERVPRSLSCPAYLSAALVTPHKPQYNIICPNLSGMHVQNHAVPQSWLSFLAGIEDGHESTCWGQSNFLTPTARSLPGLCNTHDDNSHIFCISLHSAKACRGLAISNATGHVSSSRSCKGPAAVDHVLI